MEQPSRNKHGSPHPLASHDHHNASIRPILIGSKLPDVDRIRIIGGVGYDPRQPLPVKYNDTRLRFVNARHNFWVPNDIPMGDDKMQWATGTLTEQEMWMFKCNISYLTASDSLVPDNLENTLIEHITAHEVRQYLRWQVAEEANHIESYLFILESFGLDVGGQGQIFNLYQQVPALVNKLNWNLSYTNNVCACPHPAGSLEANSAVLEDLISYYAFEFLFFPVNFSQIFALARQGKLRNTAQQYQYIWRDETLHSTNMLWMIRQIIQENPALWSSAMKDRARAIVDEAVSIEQEFGKATLPDGGIQGLPLVSYHNYVKFMADLLLTNLGLPTSYGVTTHPLPWLTDYEVKQEVNFFEGRVRDYRAGSTLTFTEE